MPVIIAPAPKGLTPIALGNEALTLSRKQVDARHPNWQQNKEMWGNVALLYEGGDAVKRAAAQFLDKRPAEDSSVYSHRLKQFCYENNLGTGLGWHEAKMFESEPTISIKAKGKDGQPTDAKLSPDQDAFYNQRCLKDCDRHGCSLVDMYREVFTNLLLYGHSYVMVDLPARDPDKPVSTLQDEKAQHLLDPYVCVLSPLDVINWECDSHRNLNWAVVYSKTEEREFAKPVTVVERWYLYTRQQYRVYEIRTVQAENSTPASSDAGTAELVRAGYHPMAALNRVPLQKIEVPPGWWMANRAYLPVLKHINVTNALHWSLFMAALAVPVVITEDDIGSIMQTEHGFIKLGIGSDYKFAEPSGRCWEALAQEAETLKQEIFREMYLVAQARDTSATPAAQSGVSKQQDMQPSKEVLNGMGDILRAAIQGTLDAVAAARNVALSDVDANLTFDVRGFQFKESASKDEVSAVQQVLNLDIPSPTFEKEVHKYAVASVIPDMNPDTRKVIFDEIDAAPAREERDLERRKKENQLLADSMGAAMGAGA